MENHIQKENNIDLNYPDYSLAESIFNIKYQDAYNTRMNILTRDDNQLDDIYDLTLKYLNILLYGVKKITNNKIFRINKIDDEIISVLKIYFLIINMKFTIENVSDVHIDTLKSNSFIELVDDLIFVEQPIIFFEYSYKIHNMDKYKNNTKDVKIIFKNDNNEIFQLYFHK